MLRRIAAFATAIVVVVFFALDVHSVAFGQTISLPAQGTVSFLSNVRSGPDISYGTVEQVQPGATIQVVDCNEDCTWYQLSDGPWIAARLVSLDTSTGSGTGQNCDPSYPSTCIPPSPPDLDCNDLTVSGFQVLQPDPHRFDADLDGIGCEVSNGSSEPTTPPITATRPTVNANANLRSGPGTTNAVVGRATVGQALALTGRNGEGTWYQLSNGAWIAAFLVDNAPANLPTASAAVTSPAAPTTIEPVVNEPATPVSPPANSCDTNYAGACVPLVSRDLDCGDIGTRFQRVGSDPHRFDADNDGIACESY